MVKIAKFWKWISSKMKTKDPDTLEQNNVESQKLIEEETKVNKPVPNGGIWTNFTTTSL